MRNLTHSTKNSCFQFYSCDSEQPGTTIKRALEGMVHSWDLGREGTNSVSRVPLEYSMDRYSTHSKRQVENLIWNTTNFSTFPALDFLLPLPHLLLQQPKTNSQSNIARWLPRPTLQKQFQFFIVSPEQIRAKIKLPTNHKILLLYHLLQEGQEGI